MNPSPKRLLVAWRLLHAVPVTRSVERARHDPSALRAARGRAAAQRGFTLAELLIVVAMVGVMAALATVGYRKYLHSAQSSEAKAVMQGIRGAEENYKAEMLVYLGPSAHLQDYYPNATPNDSKWNWIQPGDARYANPVNGWKLLHVTTDGPVRFGYAAFAGVGGAPPVAGGFAAAPPYPTINPGTPWYVLTAAGDRNNNGKFAMFFTSSFGNEFYVENEAE